MSGGDVANSPQLESNLLRSVAKFGVICLKEQTEEIETLLILCTLLAKLRGTGQNLVCGHVLTGLQRNQTSRSVTFSGVVSLSESVLSIV